jgi:hypothetical protein
MSAYNALDAAQFLGREAQVARESDWLQPELGRQVVAINMNVCRFVWFMAVKVQPVRAASQDRRHGAHSAQIALLATPQLEHVSDCLGR